MAKDPVCNNEIDMENIRYQSRFNGDIYWFDSPECKDLFDANPERYIGYLHSAAEGSQEKVAEAGRKVRDIGEKASGRAKSAAAERKGQAADFMGDISGALHSASQNLHDRHHDSSARLADRTASEVDRITVYFRDTDVNEIVRDAESYARTHPGLAIGGALAAGFIAARMLKNSGRGSSTG